MTHEMGKLHVRYMFFVHSLDKLSSQHVHFLCSKFCLYDVIPRGFVILLLYMFVFTTIPTNSIQGKTSRLLRNTNNNEQRRNTYDNSRSKLFPSVVFFIFSGIVPNMHLIFSNQR